MRRQLLFPARCVLLAALVCSAIVRAEAPLSYVEDVDFALAQLEAQCGHFFKVKGIDWAAVSFEMQAATQAIQNDQDELVLLTRLLARLKDGHSQVQPTELTKDIAWPAEGPWAFPRDSRGPGVFLCRSGKKILVKSCWGAAAQAGLKAGSEVVAIDEVPVDKWLESRVLSVRDIFSFSTDQHAMYHVMTRGLAAEPGSKLELEVRAPKKKSSHVNITYGKDSVVPVGPAFFPKGAGEKELERIGRQSYGLTAHGFGYIHLRAIDEDLLAEVDTMLAALGNPPGLILDFRANGGGGCDHDALFGRFIPAGKTLQRASSGPLPSAGEHPYGGPIVVIVDAGVVSAGETTSGMLKEDGRAYMIGDTPTAGMSSSKTVIELPSGRFNLFVSVQSNKARFQGGRGIEGIGIIPNEVVEYQAADLARGEDTLILRAELLLARFPQKEVPYDPAKFDWKPGPPPPRR